VPCFHKKGWKVWFPAKLEVRRLGLDCSQNWHYRTYLQATQDRSCRPLRGAVQDFNFAARVTNLGIVSTQFLLTPEPNVTYSACLMSKVEEMFVSGRSPYPVERTLLTSGITESCHASHSVGGRRLETPALSVTYQPPNAAQYCRT
jgi:hypothetical protein